MKCTDKQESDREEQKMVCSTLERRKAEAITTK
jgi:hypothetical protein